MKAIKRLALPFTLFVFSASTAMTQVVPAATPGPNISLFGDFSAEKLGSNTYQYGTLVYGATLGGFIQFRRFIGLEARGGLLRSGSQLHRNTALVGPRVVFSHNRFRFDGVFLVGLSHAGYIHQPITPGPGGYLIGDGINTALELAGGVDYRVTHRLYWEIGDIGYNHIFVQSGEGGVTFSTGLVVRLF
jgi:hypothetical protein